MGLAALMVVCWSVPSGVAVERRWTRSEILAIADAEARRFGYDLEQMSVSFDASNASWRDYLNRASTASFVPFHEVQAKLTERVYWAVYYAGLEEAKGLFLWVFIDRVTGDVIEALPGK